MVDDLLAQAAVEGLEVVGDLGEVAGDLAGEAEDLVESLAGRGVAEGHVVACLGAPDLLVQLGPLSLECLKVPGGAGV